MTHSSLSSPSLQKPDEYLYDNIVRIRDIELLTGMEFFTNRTIWSDEEAIALRTSLWTEQSY